MDSEITCLQVTAEELAARREECGPGLSEAELSKNEVPLRKIEVAPEAFQHRDGSYRAWDKDAHIDKLADCLEKQEGLLDPLLLYPVDGHRIVLDGHCRLMAYRETGLDASTPVPVEHFRGTFREAFTLPAARNSKEKLPLTQKERLEAAWRYVLFNEGRDWYSYRDIAKATNTSSSTVGNMHAELERADEYNFDVRESTWDEVKDGRQEETETNENWEEERAQAWASRIRQELGNKPSDTPQCLFQALEIAYGSLIPAEIPRDWIEASAAGEDYWNELERRQVGVEDFKF